VRPETAKYKAKKILTQPEQVLYFRLCQALPEYIVIAQVQMSSFLVPAISGKQWLSALNKIRMKSVDFLVCRKDFSILAAVELQDGSHKKPDRQRSDMFKRAALESAGLDLIEYHVKSIPSVDEIRATPVFQQLNVDSGEVVESSRSGGLGRGLR